MKAEIKTSKPNGTINYYKIVIVVNGKELNMRVTLEDGNVEHYCSEVFGEVNKWNELSSDEKEAIGNEILEYYK